MGNYNIVFASDKNYIQHLSVALKSLVENNLHLKFDVYIINCGLPFYIWYKLNKTVEKYNVKLIDVIVNDIAFENLIINHHFSKANYYRLLIPELIDVDKILYLDSDIVVTGSVKELYELNIDDFYLAAVEDPCFDNHEDLNMSLNSRYFNSGVMLMNNKKWRDENIGNRVINFVKKNTEVIRYVDQCGLNGVIDGNWMPIPLKYNQQAVIFEEYFSRLNHCFSVIEIEEAINNPIIIHFTGSSKPWNHRNNHPYKYLYNSYRKQTPFRFNINIVALTLLKKMFNKISVKKKH